MIRLSVMYPATPGSTFDWEYYLRGHVSLAHRLLDPRGLVKLEIDRGLGSFPPGTPAPYHAVAHLFFRDLAVFRNAMAETAADLITDVPNYASVPAVVQVSEVVEL
ncbi:MAG: EthD family reductase [Acidobacteriales bacterium]|nr:EthD family reductase [Terriglobales bacterium]